MPAYTLISKHTRKGRHYWPWDGPYTWEPNVVIFEREGFDKEGNWTGIWGLTNDVGYISRRTGLYAPTLRWGIIRISAHELGGSSPQSPNE